MLLGIWLFLIIKQGQSEFQTHSNMFKCLCECVYMQQTAVKNGNGFRRSLQVNLNYLLEYRKPYFQKRTSKLYEFYFK